MIMNKFFTLGFCFLFIGVLSGFSSCNKDQNKNVTPGDTTVQLKSASYKGLVMAGYQGWFNAEGDGADRGWNHHLQERITVWTG